MLLRLLSGRKKDWFLDEYSMGEAFLKAIEQTLAFINFTLDSLRKMLQGDISVKNLSGPLHIGEIANDTFEAGVLNFIGFIALLSISLGVINLLLFRC